MSVRKEKLSCLAAPCGQRRLLSRVVHSLFCGPLVLCLAADAWAAPPNAGSLLREELLRDRPAEPVMPPRLDATGDGKLGIDSGPTILVKGFRISGLITVTDAEAQEFLAEYAGKPLSMDGLRRVAEKFEQWLRSRGLFAAHAYLPPQDIKDGMVEIRVLEGRVEGIDIKLKPETRLSEASLRAILAKALPPGGALEQDRLERGLLLMNDLPATSARAVLVPGKEPGGSRVVVEAAQGAALTGSVDADNTGDRYTGKGRLSATLALNDAYGFGDLWSFRASFSQGTSFVRAGYTVPLGSDGWKIGASLIESRYRLCCNGSVTALRSNGEASAISAFVSYPLIRTRLNNLSLSSSLARRDFTDRSLGVTTSDKRSDTLALAVNGDRSDMAGLTGLGAYTSYAAQWLSGQLDLDGVAASKALDAATAQSQGSFDKLSGQVSHLLRLSANSALYAGFAAQWARKNLDSSEKFSIGGPQGVRAYPVGYAIGDEGWLLNLEWRRELDRDWRVAAFADYGKIRQHQAPWVRWNALTPNLDNRYGLSGIGASVAWSPTANTQFSATLASRLGSNPLADATGPYSDNQVSRQQFWIQGSAEF